jgi:DNA-binding Lrp family transcriptional regulator
VDELDAAILAELQADARQTNRELARRLGIAASTCLQRVRGLTRRGVIRAFRAEVDLDAIGRGVQAMVTVTVRPLQRRVIDEFKAGVSDMPEVLSVFVLAGNDDFLVHVAVPDLDHLHAFLVDRLSQRREVVSFRTSVIYQQVHKPVVTPIGGGG